MKRWTVIALSGFLVTALHLHAQGPVWKDRTNLDLIFTTERTDPAVRLEKLKQWSTEHPNSPFAASMRKAYLATYMELKQYANVLRVGREILASEPDDLQALTVLCVAITRYETPQRGDVEAAREASARLLANLDTFFAPGKKPLAATDAQWAQAKEEVRAYAAKARDATLVALPPDILLWRELRRALVGREGEEYFRASMQGANLPGGIVKDGTPITQLRATVRFLDGDGAVLAAIEGIDPEVRIDIDGLIAKSPEPGAVCSFSGVADSFRKAPFQLTFRVKPEDLNCR